ncbi:hypothetical protein BC936DRAFT_144543 [Jimgerdemannia flammicorona]|uniref:Zn(2)-C6 fungal-type domain-containing protein n=1 Tax=Jimgerdemannia flammicorona TaxID=994334 RepID=A0A433DC97_9FUNG|nr:hypothetical protein BC936DRAFT_144543 [Jimgerdemannia flammicorona]
MASTDSSYDYRDFQHIWNPAKTDNTPKRTREACIRCRSKRSRCDGEKPCHRCRHVHAECEYSQSKMRMLKESTTIGTYESQDDEEGEMDLLHEVHALEDALDKLSAEILQLKRRTPANREGLNDYPSPPLSNADEDKYAEGELHGKKDDSVVALGNTNIYTEKKQWVIAMTKKGIRLEATNTRQFYELLAHIVNSAAVHRGPPTVSRPIGTQAMTSLATAQWPRWRRMQKFNTKKRIPIFSPDPLFDVSTLVITSEMEECRMLCRSSSEGIH